MKQTKFKNLVYQTKKQNTKGKINMKVKRKIVLKPWVKATLLLLPEMIIIMQLFFVASKLEKLVENTSTPSVVVETRCNHE